MFDMEGKELMHLQKLKLAKREDQGNNNLHDMRDGDEPQLPGRQSVTHISGFSSPRGLPLEWWTQPQSMRKVTATPNR
jgi:hypothetical protein